jgi:integrase
MSSIVANAEGQERVLYALLAGTGMRIGEALALEVGRHISDDCRTLFVRQSVWDGNRQEPKTPSAIRDIDLCPVLAGVLKMFVGDRKSGLLFSNQAGNPLSQTNLLRRNLHPILRELGVAQCGFHAFRRFRTTRLRKQRAPEDLIQFWLGHANKTVTDEYAKLFEDVEFRKEVVDSVGLGFEIPRENAPFVRKVRRNLREEIAA